MACNPSRLIGVRVDSSPVMGIGHAIRCQTLADKFKNLGLDCHFFCHQMIPSVAQNLKECGHHVHDISALEPFGQFPPGHFRLFVIDHYGLGSHWEKSVKSIANKVLVIDDLADKPHHCDYLVNQNIGDSLEMRYQHLLNSDCKLLAGTRYAILRSEFLNLREKITLPKKGDNILVFYGGGDPTGETLKVLRVLHERFWDNLFVVIGSANPNRDAIGNLCASIPGAKLHIDTHLMPDLIGKASVALCAGGSFTWERFCLGTPGYVTTVAVNQVASAQWLAKNDLIDYLGHYPHVRSENIKNALEQIQAGGLCLKRVEKMMELVDGRGVERIAQIVLEG